MYKRLYNIDIYVHVHDGAQRSDTLPCDGDTRLPAWLYKDRPLGS